MLFFRVFFVFPRRFSIFVSFSPFGPLVVVPVPDQQLRFSLLCIYVCMCTICFYFIFLGWVLGVVFRNICSFLHLPHGYCEIPCELPYSLFELPIGNTFGNHGVFYSRRKNAMFYSLHCIFCNVGSASCCYHHNEIKYIL